MNPGESIVLSGNIFEGTCAITANDGAIVYSNDSESDVKLG